MNSPLVMADAPGVPAARTRTHRADSPEQPPARPHQTAHPESTTTGCLGSTLRAFRPSGRAEWSLFLTGINLMLVNFIMVQHATVAFRRAEIAVIAFSLAYFLGVSAGYLVSDRLPPHAIRRSLPGFLLIQMALIAGMQPLHLTLVRVAGALGLQGLADDIAGGVFLFALLAAFVASIYAVFLPRVIADTGGDLRRPYSVEVAGSLTGLIAMPFLAAIAHEAVLGAYFAAFLALMLLAGTPRRTTTLLGAVALLFLAIFPSLDRAGAAYTYRQTYGWDVEEIPFTRYTPYHKIEVVRASGENRLLLNGLRQFGGDPRRTYSYFVAEFPARLQTAPRVALLGCGSMATVGRIGNLSPSIRIVDLDAAVFNAAARFFAKDNRLHELKNWTFTPDDAKHWIANAEDRFDLILHDIPPARSRQVALTYTDDFFRLVKDRLNPRGTFSISSLSSNSGEAQYGRRMLATLVSVFDHYYALERQGSLYFYGGGPEMPEPDPAQLLGRVDPDFRRGVKVLTRAELKARAAGATVITISNVGDLIYD